MIDLFFSYDEHGRCVSAEAKKAEGASVVYQGTVGWEYDEQGRVTALISKTGKVVEYTYDEEGRVTRRAFCGVTSREDDYTWEEYEFFEDGVIRKEVWYDDWEKPSVKLCRETRDEAGRAILREYMRESERQVYRKNFFEYDGKGRIDLLEDYAFHVPCYEFVLNVEMQGETVETTVVVPACNVSLKESVS